jgi:hypothetical protein
MNLHKRGLPGITQYNFHCFSTVRNKASGIILLLHPPHYFVNVSNERCVPIITVENLPRKITKQKYSA